MLNESINLTPDEISSIRRGATDEYSKASYAYERLVEEFEEFQNSLADDEELAIMVASIGSPCTMIVTDLGYSNPNLLYFFGLVNGRDSQLIQHLSQLSFLLTSTKKPDPNKPARRIGFNAQD